MSPRVAAFIPYGRKRTVEILIPYLHRAQQQGQIDELMLCMNTDVTQGEDRAYADELVALHPGWIKKYERPNGLALHPKQMNTGRFYQYMTDPDTVYVRFDDDIVYVEPNAIPRLVASADTRYEVLTSFPIIWNNSVCSWYLERLEVIPAAWGTMEEPHCMAPLGWADPKYAELMHNHLLAKIDANDVESCFMHMDIQLMPRLQFSVSCFAVSGRDYAALSPPGHLDFPEEENWHTVHRPSVTGQVNVLVSNALVSHFSFYPQHRYLFEKTDLLARYKTVSDKVTAGL